MLKGASSVESVRSDHERIGILLVDDDVELCTLMSEYFTNQGYRIECAHDGARGLGEIMGGHFDLVVLDGMLPVLDGLEVLYQSRHVSPIPIIMLTARTQEKDRVAGLESGADDYLTKPFAPAELLARIRALLRRTGREQLHSEEIVTGPVRLRARARQTWVDGHAVELTSVEFDILSLLVRSTGRIVSRNEIAAVIYHREVSSSERAVDVHISHLRKKIQAGGRPLIQTVRGAGYLFALEN
jgi:DNA-binding response OmpR family regulator